MEVNGKLEQFIEEWSYEMENFDKEFFRWDSFKINDPVIRKWNNKLYYICHDIDNGGEYLIGKEPNTPFNKCKVCELPSNLSHATKTEVELGYRSCSGQMELFDE